MLYPQNIEQKLGFDRIRELLKEACISPLGQKFVDKMKFSDRFDVVQRIIEQTAEFKQILQYEPSFPASNYIDVNRHLSKANIEGYFLTETECYEIKLSLRTIQDCLVFFQKQEEGQYETLKALVASIFRGDTTETDETKNRKNRPADSQQPIKLLLPELDRIIDDRGHIRDNASRELQEIRKAIVVELAGLRKKLDSVLKMARKEGWVADDVSLTIRNGRMVIPILAEHKRKIRGFVQDESDTGKTVYLEPAEVLDANNEIKDLEARERREIVRILTDLTAKVRPHVESLKRAYLFLGLMDFKRAKAKLAIDLEAIAPQLSNSQTVHWSKARHPLLYLSFRKQKKQAVPLDVTLEGEQRILVVSGPNAGGKSVMLKTIGLLQYMLQCGLLVPMADFSTMGIFKTLLIDIGDEQSIDNDLSTYSSHLTNMKNFLVQADRKTLFLIDEFGTGTEPSVGGAIAESILDDLNRTGAFGVVNTHYTNLKIFADKHKGLVNGAMRYDGDVLEPLYQLEIGKPGSSFALEIAQKIGLPRPTLDRAKSKLGNQQVSFEKLVKELDIEKRVFAEKNLEYTTKQRKLDQLIEQYSALKNVLETDKKLILNQAKTQAKQLLKDANAKIEGTIREIREQGAEKLATKHIREELQVFEREALVVEEVTPVPSQKMVEKPTKQSNKTATVVEEEEVLGGEIAVGSLVRIKGQTALAEVISLKGKDAEVAIGELKSYIKLNRLERVSRREYKAVMGDAPVVRSSQGIDMNAKAINFSFNLDIRGQRGEEALTSVNAFVDDALMLGYNDLRIVHGKGDGILRTLIRNHLRQFYKQIHKLEDEHADRGGAGVTIVKMR